MGVRELLSLPVCVPWEPAHAFRPTGSIATGATGCSVGEDSVGCDARSRDGVVLLIAENLSKGLDLADLFKLGAEHF
jgi:hypothetical protein